MIRELSARLRGRLAKDTYWMFASTAVRLGLHGLAFLLVARTLGPENFGLFAATLAFVAVFAPFATFGAGNILVRDTAQGVVPFENAWGRALGLFGVAGGIVFVAVNLLGAYFVPDQARGLPLLLVAVADLACSRLTDLAAQSFQAHQQMFRMALVQITASSFRLVAALLLWAAPGEASLERWAGLYLAGACAGALFGLATVFFRLGAPRFERGWLAADARHGAWFAVSMSSQGIYNDADKVVLSRMAPLESAGAYAAAYRMADFAFAPVSSLLAATYARFFRAGIDGTAGTAALSRRLLPSAATYGLVAGLVLALSGPVVTMALGPSYQAVAEILVWLSPLPFLRGLHYLAADTLTGAGRQPLRARIQIGIAVVNVAACILAVSRFSWRGAAAVSIASDALLALWMWWAVRRTLASDARAATL